MVDARTLQHFLNVVGGYGLAEDGQFGPKSFAAARDYLGDLRYPITWPDSRTYIAIEQLFLNATGASLLVDGVAGPKTVAARDAHIPNQIMPVSPAPIVPTSNWPRQRNVPDFFGRDPRNIPLAYVTPPYQMYADYRRWNAHKVSRFACHRLVKEPIQRILNSTLDHYGPAQIRKLNLDIFSGCRVVRIVTGGVGYSMHSWGIAVDIDAANNEFRDSWSQSAFSRAIYKRWLDFWYEEGAINLGRERGYDAMHNQFARL